MNLDLYTVVIASMSTLLVTGLAMVLLWWREKSDNLRDWAVGIFLASLANVVTGLYLQHLPAMFGLSAQHVADLALLVGLTGILAGYTVAVRGLCKHFGAVWHSGFWLPTVASGLLYGAFLWPVRNEIAWALTTGYMRALMCAIALFVILRHRARLSPWTAIMTVGPLSIQGIFMFARGTAVFFPRSEMLAVLLSPSSTYLIATLVLQAFSFGLLALHIESMWRQLGDAANTDALTGLGNRRSFNLLAKREMDRSQRAGLPLWTLLIDIDHFKSINDQYGHVVGDQVLAQIGALIRCNVRATDVATRYGGEEFCVILPETNREQAAILATRILAAMSEVTRSGRPGGEPVTVSIGAAGLRPGDRRMEDFLKRADVALYEAKHAGRNCIVGLDAVLHA